MKGSWNKHKILWLDTTEETKYDHLEKNLEVDVCIVGAGLAGLNTAYQLMLKGFSICLIDAGRLCSSTSAHTTAKISSQHSYIYHHLLKNIGPKASAKYADANEWAIRHYADIIKKEKIECDFTFDEEHFFASKFDKTSKWEDEYEAIKKAGIQTIPVQKQDLPSHFRAGFTVKNRARFHPRKYGLALAKKIKQASGYIYENTTATDIKEGNSNMVKTRSGNIKAKYVVMTTHFPFYDRNHYYLKLYPYRYYPVVIKPDKPDYFKAMFYVEDKEYDYASKRNQTYKNEDVAIIDSHEHKNGVEKDTKQIYEKAKLLSQRFIEGKVLFQWSAMDYHTADRLPFIGPHVKGAKSIFVATGFNGWGMTTSMVAAKIITDAITKTKNSWSDLYDPSRLTLKASTPKFLKESASVATEFAQKVLPSNIPSCSHMGCPLHWNTAEEYWDCTCHGSIFDKKGKVLHGPALAPLTFAK